MVLNGLDHLADAAPWLKGRRLGLITSTSGVTRMLTSGIDAIHAQFPLTALFGPEHGVRGDHDAGATVETYTDPATRLPVYSLYRKDSQHMTPEMLDLVDTVIYDIQDIGARFYTYISTLLYVMRDCAAAGKELVVLDRINPLGGKVEGGLLQPGFESFVGAYPLTTRYGLTPGEFARLANEEQHIGCQLHVLPVLGWKREMLFPETGLYWMMPSPAIPNFETALLYPGTCLTEPTRPERISYAVFCLKKKNCGLTVPIAGEHILVSDGRMNIPEFDENLKNAGSKKVSGEIFDDPEKWKEEIQKLADQTDLLYLSVDADILAAEWIPAYAKYVPDGHSLETVKQNVQIVMETGKVIAFSLFCVDFDRYDMGGEKTYSSGKEILEAGLTSWKQLPDLV